LTFLVSGGTPAGPLDRAIQDLCDKYRPQAEREALKQEAFERTLGIVEAVHDDGSESRIGWIIIADTPGRLTSF